MRTKHSVVTFRTAFKLSSFESPLPAGTYEISATDEETDSVLSQGWRRVLTMLRTPALGGKGTTEQWTEVKLAELESALADDAQVFPPYLRRQGDRIH